MTPEEPQEAPEVKPSQAKKTAPKAAPAAATIEEAHPDGELVTFGAFQFRVRS